MTSFDNPLDDELLPVDDSESFPKSTACKHCGALDHVSAMHKKVTARRLAKNPCTHEDFDVECKVCVYRRVQMLVSNAYDGINAAQFALERVMDFLPLIVPAHFEGLKQKRNMQLSEAERKRRSEQGKKNAAERRQKKLTVGSVTPEKVQANEEDDHKEENRPQEIQLAGGDAATGRRPADELPSPGGSSRPTETGAGENPGTRVPDVPGLDGEAT